MYNAIKNIIFKPIIPIIKINGMIDDKVYFFFFQFNTDFILCKLLRA